MTIKTAMKFVFISFLLLFSCNKLGQKAICGSWDVKIFERNGIDISDSFIKMLKFEDDETVTLPRVYLKDTIVKECTGTWSVLETDTALYVSISSENMFFNDTYRVYFKKIKDSYYVNFQSQKSNFFMMKNMFFVNSIVMDKVVEKYGVED